VSWSLEASHSLPESNTWAEIAKKDDRRSTSILFGTFRTEMRRNIGVEEPITGML
jgi:hypothetical protein